MILLWGNNYYASQDKMGNITIVRNSDNASCFLQGDEGLEFERDYVILNTIAYPSGCFQTYESHVDACLNAYDDVMTIDKR